MMTVRRRSLVVQAARILGVIVGVDRSSALFLKQMFLNLPSVWLDTDGEFQILLGNRVPKLKKVSKSNATIVRHELTLYIIITARRLQKVAKKRPSR
jgi:hypothetical protein